MTAPLGYGAQPRAPYATDPDKSVGRLVPEPESPTRTPFQRDRDRIIHSTAFRRLKHKTQVFVYHEGDHFRTRLTHTIEVSQIARSLARALRLDEDLAECLALAHDLGHTPFGHEGEDVMDVCMAPHGGFDHNAQSLRIVTLLERRYAEFDGLNLSWETLEGLVKHNGPLTGADGTPLGKFAETGLPFAIRQHAQKQDLRLDTWPSAEAQAAAIADDIAYDAHDLDDGLRAGLLSLDQLGEVPFFADILAEVDARYPGLEEARRIHEIVRRSITRMVEDVIGEAVRRLERLAPQSVEGGGAGRHLLAHHDGAGEGGEVLPFRESLPARVRAGRAPRGCGRRPRALRSLYGRPRQDAGGVATRPRRRRRRPARAPRVRLHRRNDRPFRHRGTCAAV